MKSLQEILYISAFKVQIVAGQWILAPYWFNRAPTIGLTAQCRYSKSTSFDRMLQNAVIVVVVERKNASLYIV